MRPFLDKQTNVRYQEVNKKKKKKLFSFFPPSFLSCLHRNLPGPALLEAESGTVPQWKLFNYKVPYGQTTRGLHNSHLGPAGFWNYSLTEMMLNNVVPKCTSAQLKANFL